MLGSRSQMSLVNSAFSCRNCGLGEPMMCCGAGSKLQHKGKENMKLERKVELIEGSLPKDLPRRWKAVAERRVGLLPDAIRIESRQLQSTPDRLPNLGTTCSAELRRRSKEA